jgi:pyrroloquinoline-quinone synthase
MRSKTAAVEYRGARPLPAAEFKAAIRAVGVERYYDKHPFHKLLHGGKLNKGQVKAWGLNRYCY